MPTTTTMTTPDATVLGRHIANKNSSAAFSTAARVLKQSYVKCGWAQTPLVRFVANLLYNLTDPQ